MKLYDAIQKIVKLKGKSVISDSALLNYLSDYHAFEERPASKLVLRDVINGGYSEKILQLDNTQSSWTIRLKSYEHDFVDSCGYKEELVLYVFQSLAYAIDLTGKKPGEGMDEVLDFHPFFGDERQMPSDTTSTPEPKQTADSVDDKDYLKIAQDFVDNGKLDTARSIAEKIVNSRPKDDENTIKATIMLGHIMRKKSHYKEALDYYNQALNAEANLLNISAKDLQHRITNREVKDFEDIDIHYTFCLWGIEHIDTDRWMNFVRPKAAKGNVTALIYCAQYGIDPQNHIDIFFTDFSKIQVGDIIYTDGTFAHEESNIKDSLGVVFSLETSEIEKRKGWTHGNIMAKVKPGETYPKEKWGPSIDLPFPHTHYTQDDLNHLYEINSRLNSELLITDLYSKGGTAFYRAKHWRKHIPLKNTSGWYLPNLNQAQNMAYTFKDPKGIDNIEFWTSSQVNEEESLYYATYPFLHLETCDKNEKLSVIPIFSF